MTLLEFDAENDCTGVEDMSIGECAVYDEHFGADALPVTFFNGVRTIEIKDNKHDAGPVRHGALWRGLLDGLVPHRPR